MGAKNYSDTSRLIRNINSYIFMGLDNKKFKDLISLTEADELYGISSAHLRRLAIQGKLGAQKIGRNWVTTKEAIEEYLRNRRPPGRPKRLD